MTKHGKELCVAFVQGAKWWEWQKEGATMWPSDQQFAFMEAEKRLQNGSLGGTMNELEQRWKEGDAIRRSLMYKIMDTLVEEYIDAVDLDTTGKLQKLFRLQKKMEKLGLFDEEASGYALYDWVRDLTDILDSERGK